MNVSFPHVKMSDTNDQSMTSLPQYNSSDNNQWCQDIDPNSNVIQNPTVIYLCCVKLC